MSNLFLLEIKSAFGDNSRSLFPVVIKDGNELILVDTGLPWQLELIKKAAKEKGIVLEDLTKIVITHQDIDHIGCLAEMKSIGKNVKVVSSAIEADYISGKKPSIRMERMRKNFDKLTPEMKERLVMLEKMNEKIVRVGVDIQLTDDGLLPGCSKTKAIHTPGHLPGHISVYFEETKTLITGDAFGFENGKFFINPNFTVDRETAKNSIRKFLDYDITNIVCYHGGFFEGDCKKVFQELITE